MANEDKKDFNAMLMDSKDMPKVQIIGLIVGAKKLYSMKKVHKEKGEKILNGLKQGIENELTESIEDYECTKESEKAENIQADNV